LLVYIIVIRLAMGQPDPTVKWDIPMERAKLDWRENPSHH